MTGFKLGEWWLLLCAVEFSQLGHCNQFFLWTVFTCFPGWRSAIWAAPGTVRGSIHTDILTTQNGEDRMGNLFAVSVKKKGEGHLCLFLEYLLGLDI